jgi:hypothetical protein
MCHRKTTAVAQAVALTLPLRWLLTRRNRPEAHFSHNTHVKLNTQTLRKLLLSALCPHRWQLGRDSQASRKLQINHRRAWGRNEKPTRSAARNQSGVVHWEVLITKKCAKGAKPTAPSRRTRALSAIRSLDHQCFSVSQVYPLTCMLLNLRLSADSIPSVRSPSARVQVDEKR